MSTPNNAASTPVARMAHTHDLIIIAPAPPGWLRPPKLVALA